MANRMETTFQAMAEKGERILVTYFPLCDPLIEDQVAWAGTYFENGATVLEMGLPYENPVLDGATVKRFFREHGQVWLLPENEAYSPIDGTYAQILGKVAAVVRRY